MKLAVAFLVLLISLRNIYLALRYADLKRCSLSQGNGPFPKSPGLMEYVSASQAISSPVLKMLFDDFFIHQLIFFVRSLRTVCIQLLLNEQFGVFLFMFFPFFVVEGKTYSITHLLYGRSIEMFAYRKLLIFCKDLEVFFLSKYDIIKENE